MIEKLLEALKDKKISSNGFYNLINDETRYSYVIDGTNEYIVLVATKKNAPL